MKTIESLQKYYSKIAGLIAILISGLHMLNVSGIIVISAMPLRVLHLMAMILIAFLIPKKNASSKTYTVDFGIRTLGILSTLLSSIYILSRWEGITSSGGVTNNVDAIIGIIMILVVLEVTRRTAGNALAIIALAFLLYPFVGKYFPGLLKSRAYSIPRIFNFLFTTTEGIYGIPISVSATYIVLFCVYGAFLSEYGAGEFLYKLSSSLTRKFVAATAKTSIIFSALIGMISGSAAGNVAITGSLTIPMMVKSGYEPHKAGAISAVAATGGQIMPPVMGAAAFIMAELVGLPYSSIMKAAILPSILYFLSIFIIVHLEARKANIDIDNEEEMESTLQVLKEGWYFALPIIMLIFMMIIGYSPFKAALYSMLTLVVVYSLQQLVKNKRLDSSIFKKFITAMKKGALDTVPIAIACAAAGIIAGSLSITGLGSKLSSLIIAMSGGYLIIALFFTMIIALILGMGLPTTAAYLVLASVVAPALSKMGLPLLTAHMFVFFFGCISTITPPVALASYVAAGIAGTDLNKVGWTAFKYGIVSFILPFMFVYGPSLLLEGSIVTIIQSVILSTIGVFCIATSIVGYLKVNLKLWQRITLFISGILTVLEGAYSDILGLVLLALVIFSIKAIRKSTTIFNK